MNVRHAVLIVALIAVLPAAYAVPAHAPPSPAPLRTHLRIVDACQLQRGETPPACRTVHQRSDANTPAAPQVQALTPVLEDGPMPQRAWQTFTF